MGARCGDSQRGTTKKSGQEAVLFPGRWALGIHTSGPSACCEVMKAGTVARPEGQTQHGVRGRYKNSSGLAEPPRAADVDCNNALLRFSINLAAILQRLINADILRILPQRTSTRPWTGINPQNYQAYNCQFWFNCHTREMDRNFTLWTWATAKLVEHSCMQQPCMPFIVSIVKPL